MATQSNPLLPYDPNAAQPLDSGSAAGADSAAAAGPQLPPITAPPRMSIPEQPSAGTGPQLLPGAKGTNLGVASYLGESLLKGIMQGRERYQQMQAYKAQRLSNGLQYNYQTLANNYLALIKSGADPKSPEVQKADLQQRTAYQSLMQMRGNFIMGQDGKSKKKKGQDDQDPMQMFMSSDPKTKMKGAYLLQMKMFQGGVGTPANAAALPYTTPEYQAQKKLMSSQQTLSQGNVDDKLQLRNLEMADTSKMTPEQKSAHEQQVQGLRDRLGEAASGYKQTEKILKTWVGPDNKEHALKQRANGEEYEEILGDVRQAPGLTSRESDTTSTDNFGNVTHSQTVRKPLIGAPAGASTTPTTTAAGHTQTPTAAAGSSPAASAPAPASTHKPAAQPPSPAGLPKLDADGHIPAGHANPNITEAANQLLDGTDKDKLPMKAREPAAALARKYGWEQGKFTPKEQVMLNESSTFLKSAMTDPSLAALDAPFTDRLQLAQALKAPDKEGLTGSVLTLASAQNLDPQQVAFVQMYNQLVGTVSGMSQLVRSGRATEATIERLKAELPNPLTTKDSADAKKRIQRLMKEIDVAKQKGTFESGARRNPNANAPADNATATPASSAPTTGSKSIDEQIMEAARGQSSNN